VFDARVFLSQTVLDMSAVNDFRAAEHSLTRCEALRRSARDLVVLVAANLYLQTLANRGTAQTARASSIRRRRFHQQAINLRAKRTRGRNRRRSCEVRLSTERQRVTASTNDYEKSKLQLARVIGLAAGTDVRAQSGDPFVPVPEMTLEEALARAYASGRTIWRAQERVQEAESARKPSLARHFLRCG
jgi:outer membrane protein TolC